LFVAGDESGNNNVLLESRDGQVERSGMVEGTVSLELAINDVAEGNIGREVNLIQGPGELVDNHLAVNRGEKRVFGRIKNEVNCRQVAEFALASANSKANGFG